MTGRSTGVQITNNYNFGVEAGATVVDGSAAAYEVEDEKEFEEQAWAGATHLKVVVVGDKGVGKTSLARTFATGRFPAEGIYTRLYIHAAETWNRLRTVTDIKRRRIRPYVKNTYDDETPISMTIWDTTSEPEARYTRPLTYENAHVILICFSAVDRESFNNVKNKWWQEVYDHANGVPLILVCTKSEIVTLGNLRPGQDYINTAEEAELATEIGATYYVEVSALTRLNMDSLMESVIRFRDASKGVQD
ncbi:P-loop containing nucleoside triphosphate hydrolase protein [Lasiosphaeria ovina]|uniref:P-loop containing nucleoside triphosphate hydrolase protein n=1 Tax=Lasiosphaeria ovina TaxID=92902 RepID=A0AAE0KH55_9PEZI|nr:P-loop containing nucleoside triphosphate hydrolase protein [Lasiosphaeria ovina]